MKSAWARRALPPCPRADSLREFTDSFDGGEGFDTLYYGYDGSMPEGARIEVDFNAGTVSKYLNGVLMGTDSISNIESVFATGSIGMGRDFVDPQQDPPIPSGQPFILTTGAAPISIDTVFI